MSVDVSDVLLKAAEDVQSGMWCQGAMFQISDPSAIWLWTSIPGEDTFQLERELGAQRCALGSIAVATVLLGGGEVAYTAACKQVADQIADEVDEVLDRNPEQVIAYYNDYRMPADAFTSGSRWAAIFREAASA